MEKIKIANDAHLGELMTLFKVDGVDFDEVEYQLSDLPDATKLRLVREYNKSKDDSLEAAMIITNIMQRGWNRNRVYTPQDTPEVVAALQKCTDTYVKKGASDYDKYSLGRKLKYFVVGHNETASKVFESLQKLTDVDVIEPIRSCMSRDSSLFDAGFAAIHKSADAVCAKAQKNNEKEPQFAASEQLRLAFADLYNYFGCGRWDMEAVDKFTEQFAGFDKQIKRINPEKRERLSGNLENCCSANYERAPSKWCYEKMEILRKTFHEFEQSDKPFAEIYAPEQAKGMKKLEQLKLQEKEEAFKEKVRNKILGKADFGQKDAELWDKLDKAHDYSELKRGGDTDFNKMLMQARRDSRKK